MGLLESINLHKQLQSRAEKDFIKVEYQLHSWGEIYPPFLGNREHSIAARHILNDFPFKLFSSSIPYESLPQKLCLTFKAPYRVERKSDSFIIRGLLSHETAKEFAAFLSIITRRRVFVAKQIRDNGMPVEEEIDIYQQTHFQEMQKMKEIEPKEIYQFLENLLAMDSNIAKGFVLAMRLYHSAIEIMYTEPEFSYLFLVMCLEAISSVVHKDYKPDNEEEFLESKISVLKELLITLTPKQRTDLKRLLLGTQKFIFRKLLRFVNENIPKNFWSETEDDAKPHYHISLITAGPDGLGKKHFQESDKTIKDYEKIEKGNLKRVLQDIYKARSQLIHKGIRFPTSILIGHFRRLPPSAFAEVMETLQDNQTNHTLKIPPLLTFERLVSYSMVEFLRKQQSLCPK